MIILTKAINELLDTAGLPELTIVRNDAGYIALVGRECGKEIMVFSSMPISKKLTVEERRILQEDYLEPVVAKNKVSLQTLIIESTDKSISEAVALTVEKYKTGGIVLTRAKNHPYTYEGEEEFTSIQAKVFGNDGLGRKASLIIGWARSSDGYDVTIDTDEAPSSELTTNVNNIASDMPACVTAIDDYKAAILAEETQINNIKRLQASLAAKCSL